MRRPDGAPAAKRAGADGKPKKKHKKASLKNQLRSVERLLTKARLRRALPLAEAARLAIVLNVWGEARECALSQRAAAPR